MESQKAVTAVPMPVDDIAGDGRWLSQHNRFLTETRDQEPEVLFIGDSLIQKLQDADVWKELFQPLHALNFGIGGDTTQNLLWRITNGELEYIKPKVIVLLIGTNNLCNTAEEVADGISEIVRLISEKQPHATVIIIKLFPRGEKPNRQRGKNDLVNSILPDVLKQFPSVRIVDLDPGFVSEDGFINPLDMPDYLHLTNKAYRKAFEPLHTILVSILTESESHGPDQPSISSNPNTLLEF